MNRAAMAAIIVTAVIAMRIAAAARAAHLTLIAPAHAVRVHAMSPAARAADVMTPTASRGATSRRATRRRVTHRRDAMSLDATWSRARARP